MPADVDSLTALGELASSTGAHDPAEHDVCADDQPTVLVRRRPAPGAPRPGAGLLTAVPAALAALPDRLADVRAALRAGGSTSGLPTFAALRALPRRTRLVGLAVASVVAGMLAGLVLPVASAQPAATASGRSIIVILPAARTATPASTAAARGPSAASTAGHSALPGAPVPGGTPALASAPAVDWSAATRPSGTREGGAATASVPAAPVAAARAVSEQLPTRPSAAVVAAARAYHPTKKLPASSGSGRRVVYSQHAGHVWVVGRGGQVERDYPVTGRIGRPTPGTYHVFSKSPTAVNPTAKVRFDLMVRFAHGITGAAIGFHTIPRWYDGRPIQRVSQLGQMIGVGGCVRQSQADATWLYRWSKVGDTVVVLA